MFGGFNCEITGEPTSPDACLVCAREGGLPGCHMTPALIQRITAAQRPPNYSAEAAAAAWTGSAQINLGVSTTEILHCPRQRRLMGVEEWFEKPSKLYYAYRGSLFHAEAEKYAETDPWTIAEMRLFYFFRFRGQVVGLSGQPDLLTYRRNTGTWHLTDYKTIREVQKQVYRYTCPATGKVIYECGFRARGKTITCPHCGGVKHSREEVTEEVLPPQPRSSHGEQIQIYALLFEQNAERICAALNQKLEAAGYPDRIPTIAPLATAELIYMDMSTQIRIPVPLLERNERIGLLKQHILPLTGEEFPEILSDPAELWQCEYCAVRQACEIRHGGPVGKAAVMQQTEETLQGE